MRVFMMAVLSFLIGATTVQAEEVKDLLKCDIEKVLLVDQEECEFLGKIIGTPYQCAHKTTKGMLFWNRGHEDVAVLIDTKDNRFSWYKDRN